MYPYNKNIGFSILIIAILATTSLCKTHVYIHGDIANIRKSYSSESKIIGRLPINSMVEILDTSDQWLLINFESVIEGWIYKGIVGKAPLTEKEINDSISSTDDIPNKKKWSERLVAAFPKNKEYWEQLKDIYHHIKDTTGVQWAENSIKKRNDIYLAIGDHGRIRLLGKISAKGFFTSYIWHQRHNPLKKGVDEVLGHQLTGRTWYTVNGKAPTKYFVQSSLGPNKKWMKKVAKQSESYTSYISGETDAPLKWLDFGECGKSQIFATEPLGKAQRKVKESKGINPLSMRKQIINHDTTDYLFQMKTDSPHMIKIKPHYDVHLFELIINVMRLGHISEHEANLIGLFNENGDKIFPFRHGEAISFMPEEPKQFNPLEFFYFKGHFTGNMFCIYKHTLLGGTGGTLFENLLSIDKHSCKVKADLVFQVYSGS